MMGYPYRGLNWSGAGGAWLGGLGVIFWIVILIDLILLGFWLFKQIQKK